MWQAGWPSARVKSLQAPSLFQARSFLFAGTLRKGERGPSIFLKRARESEKERTGETRTNSQKEKGPAQLWVVRAFPSLSVFSLHTRKNTSAHRGFSPPPKTKHPPHHERKVEPDYYHSLTIPNPHSPHHIE